jgi:DsrE/DsrF-like family
VSGHGAQTGREGDVRCRGRRALQPGVHRRRLGGRGGRRGAIPGRAEDFDLPLAAPLSDLLASVVADGQVTVCTQCAQRRGITAEDVIDGVRVAGAATFAEEILVDGVQALVY